MSEELTEKEIVEGTPVEFKVGAETYYMRQPTTEEYDDAHALMGAVETKWRRRPEIAALVDEPCSDSEKATIALSVARLEKRIEELPKESKAEREELRSRRAALLRESETRTLADESASDRALLARDRYLIKVLLCNKDGDPLGVEWEKLPISIKNAARPVVWKVISAYENAPFV